MRMSDVLAPLTEAEGREALQLARRSLESWLRYAAYLKLGKPFTGALAKSCGVFVTLYSRDGNLRGCIGHMVGDGPVGELVIELALASGTRDPRFVPVSELELPDLVYEIS